MQASTNISDFEQAVRRALAPVEGTFAYESMVQNHLNTDKYRPWAAYVDSFKPLQGSVVLSSGCGSGNDFPAYLEYGATTVCGVEVEQHLIDLATLRFKGTSDEARVDVRLYDGDHLPYADAQFDIITSLHVIEHVRDMKQYVKELLRVLKPGGAILIDCPSRIYHIEQHTGKKYIHVLPHWLGQSLVKGALKWDSRIPYFQRDHLKFLALKGYCPPFPGAIVAAVRRFGQPLRIRIEQAYFHDYGNLRIEFSRRFMRPLAIWFQATTFRLLLRRDESAN